MKILYSCILIIISIFVQSCSHALSPPNATYDIDKKMVWNKVLKWIKMNRYNNNIDKIDSLNGFIDMDIALTPSQRNLYFTCGKDANYDRASLTIEVTPWHSKTRVFIRFVMGPLCLGDCENIRCNSNNLLEESVFHYINSE